MASPPLRDIYYLKDNQKKVNPQLIDIPQEHINSFFSHVNDKLTDILYSAFISMKKRCLLDYKNMYTITSGL